MLPFLTSTVGVPLAKPLTLKADDCVTYESLYDDSNANMMDPLTGKPMTGVQWCEKNCGVGFCPEDRCRCITKEEQAQMKKAAAEEAKKPKISDAELVKQMHTELPRKIPSKISGPWFYVCDGTASEPTGRQRNELYGQSLGKHQDKDGNNVFDLAGRQVPDWLASASRSGNAITLAFMDPTELNNPDHGVPSAFGEYTALLRNGTENRETLRSNPCCCSCCTLPCLCPPGVAQVTARSSSR